MALAGARGPMTPVFSAAFDPAGTVAALHRDADGEGVVEVVDLASGEVTRLAVDDAVRSALAISPDGKRVAFGTAREVRIWERARPERALSLPEASGATALAFAPDGETLFAVGRGEHLLGRVAAWSLRGARRVLAVDLPGVRPTGAAFDLARMQAAVAGQAGVQLVDLSEARVVRTIEFPCDRLEQVGVPFDPAGGRLALSSPRRGVTQVLALDGLR